MDYVLIQKTQDLIRDLSVAAWFGRVGEPITDSAVLAGTDVREAKKRCFSSDWDNVKTDAGNHLAGFLDQNHVRRYQSWNKIVRAATPLLMPIIESATERGAARLRLGSVSKRVLARNLQRDLVGACLESEFSDLMPPPFCMHLIPWYLRGHFPCGYEGEWPNGRLVIY